MTNRRVVIVGLGAMVALAAFLLVPGSSQGAGFLSPYASGHFALEVAASSAGFLQSVDGEVAKAEVVRLEPPDGVGVAPVCNIAIQFLDEQGVELYAKQVSLGPGQLESVDLPAQQLVNGEAFRVAFRVTDLEKNGKVRPCAAIPSVRVYDGKLGRTEYYLPMVTN